MRVVLSATAGYGVWLAYTALALGWRGVRPSRSRARPAAPLRGQLVGVLRRAGVDSSPRDAAAVLLTGSAAAALLAWAVFGGLAAPSVAGLVAVVGPVEGLRRASEKRRGAARDAWPQMIDEVRLLVTTAGRSIPHALLDVGSHGPDLLRPAFAEAARLWRLTTDFERTTAALTGALADATADALCEVLLVAHETGSTDVDARLTALCRDRTDDLRHRREAEARQAGVRFARRFVLIVPLGMAACGLSIGTGRAAYGTRPGQVLVCAGILAVGACWLWAGALLRLPDETRTLAGRAS